MMDRRRTKTVVSRLLRQSILELCKASVPQDQGVEVDGIVCISIGDDDDQIVVKVHEQMGVMRPGGQVSSSQSNGRKLTSSPIRDGESLVEYQRKRQNLHSITSAASAKRLRMKTPVMLEPDDKVESSGMSVPLQSPDGGDPINTSPLWQGDMQLLTAIKTEIPSDDEPSDGENSGAQAAQNKSQVSSQMAKYLGSASLDTGVFRDLECEHCKLLLPTFEELKAHNDREHQTSTCGYCWRSFQDFTNYQQHLKSHRRMRVGSRSKTTHKDMAIKRKKCGVCSMAVKSYSSIIEHLRIAHQYEKCLTCITCDEYFPNRQTFVEHRKRSHTDVQQCRCENCEIYLTYVEFKHHEKECFGFDVVDPDRVKRPIHPRLNKSHQEEADSGQLIMETDRNAETMEAVELTSHHADGRELQLNADNVLCQILQSDHSILEQTKALVTVKTKEPECSKVIVKSTDDGGSVCSQSETSSNQLTEPLEIVPNHDEDDDDEDGESDNDESETSLGDGNDFMSVLATPNLSALLSGSSAAVSLLDQSYPRTPIPEKSNAVACQGPYRCQTCFFVIEQFEDFERHCFEMHCRYVCTYCAQTFANRRNLQRHIRRHIGDMPYRCDECGERFYRDDNLRRHKLKHMTSVRFVCSYCSIPCDNKNKLTSHLIGGHAIDVLKVTEQEIMKHVILKDDPLPVGEHSVNVFKVTEQDIAPSENQSKLLAQLVGGHAIDVLQVTEQDVMQHVVLKDNPIPVSEHSEDEAATEVCTIDLESSPE